MKRYEIPRGVTVAERDDGEWVRYADHVEAMKRVATASASAQQGLPVAWAVWRKSLCRIHTTSDNEEYIRRTYGDDADFEIRPLHYATDVEAMKRIAGAPASLTDAQRYVIDRAIRFIESGSHTMIARDTMTDELRILLAGPAGSSRLAGDTQGEAEKIAHALSSADWSGVSIGNKALIIKAVQLLAAPAPTQGTQDPVCRTCYGRGTVNRWERVGESDFNEWEDDCPVCGGAGHAPEHVQKLHDQLIATRQDLHNVQMRIASADIRALLATHAPIASPADQVDSKENEK